MYLPTNIIVRIHVFFTEYTFELNGKSEVKKSILKCDFIRCSPSEISTIDTANSQIYFNIPREDSVIFLLNSHLDLNFDVLHAATNYRYADNNDK